MSHWKHRVLHVNRNLTVICSHKLCTINQKVELLVLAKGSPSCLFLSLPLPWISALRSCLPMLFWGTHTSQTQAPTDGKCGACGRGFQQRPLYSAAWQFATLLFLKHRIWVTWAISTRSQKKKRKQRLPPPQVFKLFWKHFLNPRMLPTLWGVTNTSARSPCVEAQQHLLHQRTTTVRAPSLSALQRWPAFQTLLASPWKRGTKPILHFDKLSIFKGRVSTYKELKTWWNP